MKFKLTFLLILLALFLILFLKKEPVVTKQNVTIKKEETLEQNNSEEEQYNRIEDSSIENNTSVIKEVNLSKSIQKEEKNETKNEEKIDKILADEEMIMKNLSEGEERIRLQIIKEQEELLEMYDLN